MEPGIVVERVVRALRVHEKAEIDLLAVLCDLQIRDVNLAIQTLIRRNKIERVPGTNQYRLRF